MSSSAVVRSPTSPLRGSPQYTREWAPKEAGSKLLTYYQDRWQELHEANERNAKAALKSDRDIDKLHQRMEKKWNEVSTLQMLVGQIPKVNEQIQAVMNTLGDLETTFNDAEIALMALEETIEARKLQEKQLEQRFRAAVYQEKRKAAFEQLEEDLKRNFNRNVKKHPTAAEDHLTVPAGMSNAASLETVDLNDTSPLKSPESQNLSNVDLSP